MPWWEGAGMLAGVGFFTSAKRYLSRLAPWPSLHLCLSPECLRLVWDASPLLGCAPGVPGKHWGSKSAVGVPHGGGMPEVGMDGAINHGAISNQLHPGW